MQKPWGFLVILYFQLREEHSLWAAWVCKRQRISLSVLQGAQDLEAGGEHPYFYSPCQTYMSISVIPTEAVE